MNDIIHTLNPTIDYVALNRALQWLEHFEDLPVQLNIQLSAFGKRQFDPEYEIQF